MVDIYTPQQPLSMAHRLLTKSEASYFAHCSERKIDRAIASGELHAFRNGRVVLFKWADLCDWLSRYSVTPRDDRDTPGVVSDAQSIPVVPIELHQKNNGSGKKPKKRTRSKQPSTSRESGSQTTSHE